MPTTKFAKLRNARVLVIGGTAGIGLAVAEGSLEAGAIVTIASSNPDRVSSAVSQLKVEYPEAETAGRISGYVCDLSKADKIEANIKSLLEFTTSGNTHKIDHVVFTAGDLPAFGQLSGYQATGINLTFATIRHDGGVVLGKLAPGYMNSGPRSSITFTGGTTANKPPKGRGFMAGIASYLEGMARGLAVDLAPLRVNLVSLGAVDTELLRARATGEDGVARMFKLFADGCLLGTVGSPEDVAEAYIYCMKDAFVTGQVLITDGGRLLK